MALFTFFFICTKKIFSNAIVLKFAKPNYEMKLLVGNRPIVKCLWG